MTEKDLKVMMIGNIVIDSVFYICVTVAAIYLRKPSILAWYLLKAVLYYRNKPSERETCCTQDAEVNQYE